MSLARKFDCVPDWTFSVPACHRGFQRFVIIFPEFFFTFYVSYEGNLFSPFPRSFAKLKALYRDGFAFTKIQITRESYFLFFLFFVASIQRANGRVAEPNAGKSQTSILKEKTDRKPLSSELKLLQAHEISWQ